MTKSTFLPGVARCEMSREVKLKELRYVLQTIAQVHNKTMAQLAIAWVLRQPAVTGAINGVRSPQEALAMPGGLNWKLTDQELQTIEEALLLF